MVKENIGTEIEDFRPHFAGDIYIDEEVSGTSSPEHVSVAPGYNNNSHGERKRNHMFKICCRNTSMARSRGRWGL